MFLVMSSFCNKVLLKVLLNVYSVFDKLIADLSKMFL